MPSTRTSEHADFGNGWIEIFRAGSYGDKGSFSAEDLDRVIASYDPQQHEAPACIGHPKDNLPAYGWASQLTRQGDTLLARFKEVDPAFEDAVKAGRFKKRSAAFYLDDAGRISGLRHVAFLGAQPPEVKGLKNLNFDDNGRAFTSVEFGEGEEMPAEKSVKDQIKEFFAEMFGGEKQGATFSEADAKRIASEAVDVATKPLQEKITALEGELQQKTAKFSERETAIAAGETKQRAVDAVNVLKAKGLWVPAFDKMGGAVLFEELAKLNGTVEFGEADKEGKKPQVSPLQIMVAFMEGLPKIVPSGRAVDPRAAARKPGQVNFTEGHGVKADQNSVALTEQAKVRAKEKNISFDEALDQVVSEHPELTVAAGSSAGAV